MDRRPREGETVELGLGESPLHRPFAPLAGVGTGWAGTRLAARTARLTRRCAVGCHAEEVSKGVSAGKSNDGRSRACVHAFSSVVRSFCWPCFQPPFSLLAR